MRAKELDKLYDYLAPESLSLRLGDCVEVPFGRRSVEGYVIALRLATATETQTGRLGDDGTGPQLRAVTRSHDAEERALPDEWVPMIAFLRSRYLCSWAAAVQTVMPAVKRVKEARYLTLGALPAQHQLDPALVKWLGEVGVSTQEKLSARFGLTSLQIDRYVSRGWLLRTRTTNPRMKPRVLTFVKLTQDSADLQTASLGKKQRAVIQTLQMVDGQAFWRDVAQMTGADLAVARALAQRGLLTISEVAVQAEVTERALEPAMTLTQEQAVALAAIAQALRAKDPTPHLLKGVTGSGKTEVYLQAIAETLAAGRSAIVLLPEIALTTQMTERFHRRFGDRVAVLHSGLSDADKYREWQRIRRGAAKVVLGARSAVFAPVSELGLIVMDEEHETSYKQDSDPRYVTREVAVWRGQQVQAVTVLGSATPSLETMYRASTGHYRLLSLPSRVGDRPLPVVEIVDMRGNDSGGRQSLFSRPLQQELAARLARREQSILFLNRRGYSTILLCRDCGEAATCPSCDISLTLHRAHGALLRCHFCGYREPQRAQCASCGSDRVRPFGAGTQRVESELLERYPDIRVIRMDVDTTATKGAHERMLREFARGEADVLLGTQMIAKGLDFPNVTLVGVIAADTALRVPDFRAAERTFQLLVQVGGRAGRHALPGKVIVQTFAPEHYAIQTAALQDYDRFYELELAARGVMRYPPYTEICKFLVASHSESQARTHAQALHDRLLTALAGQAGVTVLSAVPATLARLRNQFRYQIVLIYKSFRTLRPFLQTAYEEALLQAGSDVLIHIDINAHSLM